MNKFFVIITLLLFQFTCVLASEDSREVYLNSYEQVKLNVPASSVRMYATSVKDSKNEYRPAGISITSDEEVFDSKAGQFFTNFIDKKVINNKYSRFTYDEE